MIKQVFHVEDYWKVIVYYNVDYDLFDDIYQELRRAAAAIKTISNIYNVMSNGRGKAVTYSNIKQHKSIVLFNLHKSKIDYVNSLVHEAEHIKQAMLEAYNVKDEGEDPAYTIGYLVSKMWKILGNL